MILSKRVEIHLIKFVKYGHLIKVLPYYYHKIHQKLWSSSKSALNYKLCIFMMIFQAIIRIILTLNLIYLIIQTRPEPMVTMLAFFFISIYCLTGSYLILNIFYEDSLVLIGNTSFSLNHSIDSILPGSEDDSRRYKVIEIISYFFLFIPLSVTIATPFAFALFREFAAKSVFGNSTGAKYFNNFIGGFILGTIRSLFWTVDWVVDLFIIFSAVIILFLFGETLRKLNRIQPQAVKDIKTSFKIYRYVQLSIQYTTTIGNVFTPILAFFGICILISSIYFVIALKNNIYLRYAFVLRVVIFLVTLIVMMAVQIATKLAGDLFKVSQVFPGRILIQRRYIKTIDKKIVKSMPPLRFPLGIFLDGITSQTFLYIQHYIVIAAVVNLLIAFPRSYQKNP